MVGREVNLVVKKKETTPGDVVCSIQDLVVADKFGNVVVDDVSLDIRAGEILGVAGVQGNGQTELVEAITGLTKIASGKITLIGQDISKATPRQITELGSAHVPEDRQADGLVLPFSVAENLVLCSYHLPPFSKGIILQYDTILKNAEKLIQDFDIRTPSPLTSVGSLSVGNQQKVIIARELSAPSSSCRVPTDRAWTSDPSSTSTNASNKNARKAARSCWYRLSWMKSWSFQTASR
jgi:simple sugar transport system ATP-binding protein